MKTTKQQLRQIIKEELEVILTNEEAGELFGEGVEAQLEEEELNEDLTTIMQNLTPENLELIVRSIIMVGTTFGVPMLVAALGKLGIEAAQAARMAGEAAPMIGDKDSGRLVDFLYNEITGYKDSKQPEGEQMMEQEKVATDVARVGKKLGGVQGLEMLLASIDNREKFEAVMKQFIQMVAKDRLKPSDVKMGVRNVAAEFLKVK
tara:strand:- start:15 stop:629 length:615 start_codon:yes stop_codon:yes gene_type:complete